MATTEQELARFTQFAKEYLGSGEADLSLDELFDLWRTENPSDVNYSENAAAIAGAIEDFKNGNRGRPVAGGFIASCSSSRVRKSIEPTHKWVVRPFVVPPLGGFSRCSLVQDRLKAELQTIHASALYSPRPGTGSGSCRAGRTRCRLTSARNRTLVPRYRGSIRAKSDTQSLGAYRRHGPQGYTDYHSYRPWLPCPRPANIFDHDYLPSRAYRYPSSHPT